MPQDFTPVPVRLLPAQGPGAEGGLTPALNAQGHPRTTPLDEEPACTRALPPVTFRCHPHEAADDAITQALMAEDALPPNVPLIAEQRAEMLLQVAAERVWMRAGWGKAADLPSLQLRTLTGTRGWQAVPCCDRLGVGRRDMEHHWDTDGFLATSADAVANALLERHRSHFQRAAELNRDCHELLFSCEPRNRDGQQVVVCSLFLRILEHFQATVMLLQRGLVSPAVVMGRAELEAVFAARAIALHPDALRRFILDDQVERLKLAHKAEHYAYPNLEELRREVAKGLQAEIKSEIQADEAKRFSTEDMSRLAGMHEWYVIIYPLWSKTAHSRVRDLEQYLDFDEKREIRSLKYAPGLDRVSLLLLTAMHALLLGADALGRLFDRDCPASFTDHKGYLRRHLESPGAAQARSVGRQGGEGSEP